MMLSSHQERAHNESTTAHSSLRKRRLCIRRCAFVALGKEIAHSALGKGECAFGAAHSALRKRRLRIRRFETSLLSDVLSIYVETKIS
jgi:hypothetical protein